jgi:SPP1 gp7 family putative phage head morphogenesis protein
MASPRPSPASKAEALRQRRARVAQSKTRAAKSKEARRIHGPKVPSSLSYAAGLRALVKSTWSIILDGMAGAIAQATRQDALDTRTLAGAVRVHVAEHITKRAPAVIDKAGKLIDQHNAAEHKRVLGIDPRFEYGVGDTLAVFRRENVKLITTIAEDQLDRVQKVLDDNFGLRHEELSEKLQEQFGVTERKADRIARDQTLKLNGDLTRIRQQNAGVDSYVWTDSGDERVREEHATLDGQTFRWDAPPSVGHPSEDFECRCTAYPVVPGLDDD